MTVILHKVNLIIVSILCHHSSCHTEHNIVVTTAYSVYLMLFTAICQHQ